MLPAAHKQTATGRYRLVFADDFTAPQLDRSKWIPYYLPQWSSRAASQPRYRMGESCLTLEIAADQQPWCPEFNGPIRVSSLQTGLYAGPLGSAVGQHRFSPACRVREEQPTEYTFTPQYGYVELRAMCRMQPQNVAALWMIGIEEQPEQSAEICIFELKGKNSGVNGATIGYGIHPFGDPSITDAFFEEPFAIDTGAFQCYAAEWTATDVHFYINNVHIRSLPQSPAYPMQLMLNIYDLSEPQLQREPMEFIIDYVCVYQLEPIAD
ncbi:MAG: glycoside hydrolase family 16 protein [Chloroflexaceae bacterium]|jgi:hypothetical protein|nr:glycoside hydrolase family 16 protein [Chloroflexaceae bacterium]